MDGKIDRNQAEVVDMAGDQYRKIGDVVTESQSIQLLITQNKNFSAQLIENTKTLESISTRLNTLAQRTNTAVHNSENLL